MNNFQNTNFGRLSVFLVIVIAFLVRIYGIQTGLPGQYNIDESHVVAHAIKFGSGDLNPHFFFYPTLQMYILFFLYILYFAIGSLLGVFASAADFGMQYFIDPTNFYLIARTVAALMGAATVWLCAAFAGRHFGKGASIVAALFIAFNSIHAQGSHYSTLDVPMTFWIMLSLYLAPLPGAPATRRNYVLAGIAGGAAMATKYTAMLLVPVLVFAHILVIAVGKKEKNPFKYITADLFFMGGAFAAAFLVCAPFTILDFKQFMADMSIQRSILQYGWLGTEHVTNPILHAFTVFLPQSMGWPQFLFCAAGVVYAAVRRSPAGLFSIFFLLMYLVTHAGSKVVLDRHVILILPVLAVMGGRLVADIAAALPFDGSKKLIGLSLASLALVWIPANQVIKANEIMTRTDTREIARKWVEQNVPSGTGIALELGSPMMQATPESILDRGRAQRYSHAHIDAVIPFFAYKDREPVKAEVESKKGFHLKALEKVDKKYNILNTFSIAEYPLSLYRSEGYQYLIAVSSIYGRYFNAEETYPEAVQFYRSLDKKTIKVFEVPEQPNIRPGPAVKIYYIPPAD